MRISIPQAVLGTIAAGCLLGIPGAVSTIPAVAQNSVDETGMNCAFDKSAAIVERFARDTLVYRSWHYARAGNMEQAAHALRRAIVIAEGTTDPLLRTELIGQISGLAGSQPSTFQQILEDAIATQQLGIPLELLPEMEAIAQPLNDLYPALSTKTRVLTRLANTYLQLEQPEQAQRLLAQAWQTASFADRGAFAIMVAPIAKGYLELGDTEQAITILNRALQAGEAVTQPDESYQAQIFEPIAMGYAQVGKLEDAVQIAERIQAAGSRARVLASVAGAYVQLGQLAEAESQFQHAITAAQSLSDTGYLYDPVLAEVAIRYAQAAPSEAALALVDRLESPVIKANTLAALAVSYSQHNRIAQAKALITQAIATLDAVPFYEQPEQFFLNWSETFVAANQVELLLELANVSQMQSFIFPSELLWMLAERTTAAGAYDVALQIAEMIPRADSHGYYRNSALQQVAVGYARSGDPARALEIIETMGLCNEQVCQAIAFIAVAETVSNNDQPVKALMLLDQAHESLKAVQTPDSNTLDSNRDIWIELSTQYAVQYNLTGQVDQAVDWLDQLADRLNTLEYFIAAELTRQVMSDFLKMQQVDLAVQLVQNLEDTSVQGAGWYEVVFQLLEQGETELAKSLVEEVPTPEGKAQLLIALTDDAIGIRDLTLAKGLLAEVVAIAQTISGPDVQFMHDWDRASTFSAISIRYASLGQYTQAAQIAEMITDETERINLLQRLVCYQDTAPAIY